MGNRRSRLTEEELHLEVNKQKFLHSLKKTYKLQYDAVQPIPYIKDRLYRVDKVFIEGGIEIYIAEDDQWVGIKSYKGIFTDPRIKSTRRIIQAEAGYGKSTSTLQLAYDWCKGVKDSPLKDVDILILLRLRQLGGITSIFEAIKRLLVPDDQQIKSTDIKNIIESCTSVEILLDGYDEYPDQDTETGSDVERIITGEMFPMINVSITTRYIPKEFDQDITKHVKFTGFDDTAREKYILKAVTDNKRKVRKIKEALQANPILDDLCEVPLLFVMFAHMSHEEKEFLDCKSVTDFFRYMMKCFHSHMRNKRRNNNTEPYNSQFEIEHTELDKVAFEGLANENQQLSWDKKIVYARLGEGLYNHYLALGLLVEITVVVMSENIRQEEHTIIEVHFYHKLFCEWFAAFRLVKIVAATEDATKVKEVLDKFDPNDLQYLFRFSCGIDSKNGSKIVTYLKRRQYCRNFAILCIMEQTEEMDEDIKGIVTEVCSEEIKLQTSDSKYLQRSTIQVLYIASRTEIAVSCLSLDTCFTSADQSEITLESGLRVPNLSSLEQLKIKEQKGKIFTAEEILGAIRYGIECHNLKKISFIDCVLPLSFDSNSLIPTMKTHALTVSLKLLDLEFHLDISGGKWIEFLPASTKGQNSLRVLCSSIVYLRKTDSKQLQMSTILLLEIASSHNIPISHLYLEWSFSEFDGKDIRLESGLSLSSLSSVEKISINAGDKQEFTEEEVVGLINYGIKSPRFKGLWLLNRKLPSWINPDIIPEESRSRNIKVISSNEARYLDLISGTWRKPGDIQTITEMCSGGLVIHRRASESVQRSVIELLVEASNHDIPIFQVDLTWSFIKIDEDGNIILSSGLLLPILTSIERMEIQTERGRELNKHEVNGILNYVQHSKRFKQLDLDDCLLPSSIPVGPSLSTLKSRGVNVFWIPDSNKTGKRYTLNLDSGLWRPNDIQTITEMCSDTLIISRDTSESVQRSVIELLVKASNHDIPIYCVSLVRSFSKIDEDGNIILSSGLSLPIITSIEIMQIQTERGREMNKHEVNGILNYLQHSQRFEQLQLDDCLLPSPIPVGPSLSTLESRGVNVFWTPDSDNDDDYYSLELDSGSWEKVGSW